MQKFKADLVWFVNSHAFVAAVLLVVIVVSPRSFDKAFVGMLYAYVLIEAIRFFMDRYVQFEAPVPVYAFSDATKRRIALHEIGHAIVAAALGRADQIELVTVVPNRSALGRVSYVSNDENLKRTCRWYLDQAAGSLAGRAAEVLVLGEATSFSSGDLQAANAYLKEMIESAGLGEGELDLLFVGKDESVTDDLLAKIEQARRAEIRRQYDRAARILTDNRERLEQLADHLLLAKTIRGKELVVLLAPVRRDTTDR